jgi:hypothetical protein
MRSAQTARRRLHEGDFKFGKTIEDAFADQVHERDHQLERKSGHVHVAVFFHALAADAHHTPYTILPVVLRTDGVSWTDSRVYVELTRDKIKNAPKYDPSSPLSRDYETRLHKHYGRSEYWGA